MPHDCTANAETDRSFVQAAAQVSEIDRLIAEARAAFEEVNKHTRLTDSVALGREPTKAAEQRYRVSVRNQDRAVRDLWAFEPANAQELALKTEAMGQPFGGSEYPDLNMALRLLAKDAQRLQGAGAIVVSGGEITEDDILKPVDLPAGHWTRFVTGWHELGAIDDQEAFGVHHTAILKPILEAPHDDEGLAAKLRFVQLGMAVGETIHDMPLIQEVITALEARAASDAALAVLTAEFERRWSLERAGIDNGVSDEQATADCDHTGEIVRQIEQLPGDTLPVLRAKARLVAWAYGDPKDAIHPEDSSTSSRITARLLADLLGETVEPPQAVNPDGRLIELGALFEHLTQEKLVERIRDRNGFEETAAIKEALSIPARTLAGLAVKARMAWAHSVETTEPNNLDVDEEVRWYIMRDLLALGGAAPAGGDAPCPAGMLVTAYIEAARAEDNAEGLTGVDFSAIAERRDELASKASKVVPTSMLGVAFLLNLANFQLHRAHDFADGEEREALFRLGQRALFNASTGLERMTLINRRMAGWDNDTLEAMNHWFSPPVADWAAVLARFNTLTVEMAALPLEVDEFEAKWDVLYQEKDGLEDQIVNGPCDSADAAKAKLVLALDRIRRDDGTEAGSNWTDRGDVLSIEAVLKFLESPAVAS